MSAPSHKLAATISAGARHQPPPAWRRSDDPDAPRTLPARAACRARQAPVSAPLPKGAQK